MKSVQLYLLFALFSISVIRAQAQTDSVWTEYKTEDEKISKDDIKRLIRYVTRADVEEKTLIKVGGIPGSATFIQAARRFSAGLNTELTIERKVAPSFSILLGFDNQTDFIVRKRQSPSVTGIGAPSYWLPERSFSFSTSAKAAVRYYYSMARRIRNGTSANNLSGFYLAAQVRRPVYVYSAIKDYNVMTAETRSSTLTSSLGLLNSPSLSVQWGVQQRLGRNGYVDINGGPVATLLDKGDMNRFSDDGRIVLLLQINAFIGLGW